MKHYPMRKFAEYKLVSQTILGITILMFILGTNAVAQDNDPMNDQKSMDTRTQFAECRALNTPISQFLCNCRVVEQQCEAARHPEHGAWKTVEFWPSDNEAYREVQFLLFLDYDILGGFDVLNTGLAMTCMQGVSDFNVFVGQYIDPESAPSVSIDSQDFDAKYLYDDGSWYVNMPKTIDVYNALQSSAVLTVDFQDFENEPVRLEFETRGFDQVTRGWEKICHGPSS